MQGRRINRRGGYPSGRDLRTQQARASRDECLPSIPRVSRNIICVYAALDLILALLEHRFMWNPLSWVMEGAALVAIALSNGGGMPPDWEDFVGYVFH